MNTNIKQGDFPDDTNDSHNSSDIRHSFVNAESIFSALASDKRLGIIDELFNVGSARSVDLAKKLNIGQQLLHEHITKLDEAGLVKRDGEREFSLTTFGETIAGLIDTYLFLSRHKDYFSDHKFGEMPTKFVRRIGDLSSCEFVKGISDILDVWKKVQNDAGEYVYVAVPEIPLFIMEKLVGKIKESQNRNFGIRCIFLKERPKPLERELDRIGYKEFMKSGIIKERRAGKIQAAVVLNEKQSFVFFPNLRGETDMLSMFYGESSSDSPRLVRFHEWCLDYFRYKWHEHDPVLLDSAKI